MGCVALPKFTLACVCLSSWLSGISRVSENDPKFVAVSSVFRDGYTHFLSGDERWHAVKLPFQESNTPECGSAYPAT